jgi:hypothetical protein
VGAQAPGREQDMRERIADYTDGMSKFTVYHNDRTGYYEAQHEYSKHSKPTIYSMDFRRMEYEMAKRGFTKVQGE